MEEMGTELEFDELERLIGENVNVASGNAHAEESVPKSLSSISANSCEGPSVEKLHSNGNLMDRNVSMSELQQSTMNQMLTRENHNHSLAFAFEKLSFNDEAHEHAWKSSQSRTILLEDHFPDNLNEQLFNVDASIFAALSSSNHLTSGVHDFHMARIGQQNSPSSRPVSEEYKKWQVGHLRAFETSSPAMPLTHEVPDVQFPIPSHRQQLFQNGRSPLHHIQSQQINHRQIGWNFMEEEQFYRMHGQYPYLHHHNQPLECVLPSQPRENITSRMSCLNHKQQYFEVPISQHLEQSNHEPFLKTCAICRGSNQLNPVFSTQYMDTIQGREKISWQSFPRKILARTHGLNTVDAMKFVSVDVDKSPNHVNQNRIIHSNSCFRINNMTPTTESFCHDDFGSSALFSDSGNHKLLPQKFNSVDEVTGRIYLMAKDQHGCRFLQRKFVEGTRKDIEKIFNEIIDHVVELMTDPFGNYLVQKLLEVCDEDQRMQILHQITRKHGELIRISCDMHGTRAIQKVIETLKTPEQFILIVNSLKTGIVTLMKNINGNHVAQHCLEYLMPGYSELLFDAARNFCVELATDRHGCCVLQKCLSCSDGRQRDSLISEITLNALVISQDQYGNYVVQFILKLQLPWATINILKQLEGNYGDLSMQKYSSNVVEKCMQYADGHLAKIVDELMNDPRFDKIMQDPYGNYAIQTALHQTEGTLHAKLVDAVRPHVPALRTSPYGKKVFAILGKTN